MTRIAALANPGGWHVRDLGRAAAALGITLDTRPFPSLSAHVGHAALQIRAPDDLAGFDAVLVRSMPPGSLEQVVFRMDALHVLHGQGMPVVNPPRAVEIAVDKLLALCRLQDAGLRVPETWSGESSRDALAAFHHLGGDVVVKPIFGSEGRGMVRVTDSETAGRVFRALEQIHAIIYVQKFLPSRGYDVRAFVIGDRVAAAARRHPPPREWRANLAQGARAESIALDSTTGQIARAASAAVGTLIAGVDLLPVDDGPPFVLEVNAAPSWRGLSAATGTDIAAAILRFIVSTLGRQP